MPRDGSGNFTLPFPDFTAFTTIVSAEVDANNTHIADALTQSIARDGQTVPTANLPMGGFRHTGLGEGTAATDSVHLRQVQSQAWMWAGTAGGTADALTLTVSPAIGAYAAGQAFRFVAASGNTGAATVNISGQGAKSIQNNGNALVAGDIVSGKMYEIVYDGTQFQLQHITAVQPLAGPASSSDNALVRWDGTGGSAVQNSANGPFADDSGRVLSHASNGAMIGGQLGNINHPPGSDLDDVTGLGWYLAESGVDANTPASGFWFVLTTGDSNVRQVAFATADTGLIYTRRKSSGVWQAWVRLITEGSGGTLTKGFDAEEFDAGTKSSGTFTPDPAGGNFQKAVNGGAHTLAPPGKTCTLVIQYTNNSSAGTITTSGFTLVDGDGLTTTDGHDFLLYITEVNGFSRLTVTALQ